MLLNATFCSRRECLKEALLVSRSLKQIREPNLRYLTPTVTSISHSLKSLLFCGTPWRVGPALLRRRRSKRRFSHGLI